MGEESHVGGNLCGNNPESEESRVKGIPWGEFHVRNLVGRNPVGRNTMTTLKKCSQPLCTPLCIRFAPFSNKKNEIAKNKVQAI